MAAKFTMSARNDYVVVRIEKREGLDVELPDQSIEGKRFVVVNVGPSVNDLDVGDEVLMVGRKNEHYYEIPGQKDLIILKQEYVVLVDRSNRGK